MEKESLGEWLHRVDEILMQENEVLDALQQAVRQNFMDETEAETQIRDFHNRVCPQVDGSDL